MRFVTCVLAGAVLLPGCTAVRDGYEEAEETTTAATTSSAPSKQVQLAPAPDLVRRACAAERRESRGRYPVFCPTVLPRLRSVAGLRVDRWPRTGWSWYGLSVNGAPAPTRGAQLPILHLEIVGGLWEGHRPAWSPRAWLTGEMGSARTATFGGRTGKLYTHPSYEQGGGVFGGHLTFIWRDGPLVYAASLHRWKPGSETERVLERLVASLR